MTDDVSDIADFYNSQVEKEHNRLEQHQLEYDMTWRYLERYLPARGNILEVGAATGRYTVELARRGYRVTAVDLSPGLLEECRKNVTAAGLAEQVRFALADARDLGEAAGRAHDAVLLMGPLYHLMFEADRELALRQAYDRLRPGGVLVSSFITRYGIFGELLKKVPEWIYDQDDVRSLLAYGRRPDDRPPGGFRGYFAQVGEIAPLHERAGFETLVVAAAEPGISANDESYNRLEGEQRRMWLDLLFEVSTEPNSIGASRHLLYIGRKR